MLARIFSWFRSSQTNNETEKPAMYVLSKEEYETLVLRLRNLESMINALPIRPEIPEPPPMPEVNITQHSQPKVVKHLNSFQQELTNKLARIRENMGASHGFGIGDAEDMDYLEKSIVLFK